MTRHKLFALLIALAVAVPAGGVALTSTAVAAHHKKHKRHHHKKHHHKKKKHRAKTCTIKAPNGMVGSGTNQYGFGIQCQSGSLFSSFTVTTNKRVQFAHFQSTTSGAQLPCTATGPYSYSCVFDESTLDTTSSFTSPDPCSPSGFTGTVTVTTTKKIETLRFTGTCS